MTAERAVIDGINESAAQFMLRDRIKRAIDHRLYWKALSHPELRDFEKADTLQEIHAVALRAAAGDLETEAGVALAGFFETAEAEAYRQAFLAGASSVQNPRERGALVVTTVENNLRLMEEGFAQKHVDMFELGTWQERAGLAGAELLVQLAQRYLSHLSHPR